MENKGAVLFWFWFVVHVCSCQGGSVSLFCSLNRVKVGWICFTWVLPFWWPFSWMLYFTIYKLFSSFTRQQTLSFLLSTFSCLKPCSNTPKPHFWASTAQQNPAGALVEPLYLCTQKMLSVWTAVEEGQIACSLDLSKNSLATYQISLHEQKSKYLSSTVLLIHEFTTVLSDAFTIICEKCCFLLFPGKAKSQ